MEQSLDYRVRPHWSGRETLRHDGAYPQRCRRRGNL